MRASAPQNRQRGLTLVELMISIVIALILMAAIVTAYSGSSAAARTAQLQGRMNEDAQAALGILARELRQAGNNPAQPDRAAPQNNPLPTPTFAVRGCDQKFTNLNSATSTFALTCAAAGPGAGPASIAIVYEADAFNTVPNSHGTPTDCLGSSLASIDNPTFTDARTPITPTFYVAENRFYIGTSTVIVNPSLYCMGNGGGGPQPLVENIENLALTYGTATPAATSTVAGYLAAYTVDNDTTTLSGSLDNRWRFVRTVRVCVIVRSAEPVAPTASSASYYDCAGNRVTSPPDLRLRRAFTTTVVLRNP